LGKIFSQARPAAAAPNAAPRHMMVLLPSPNNNDGRYKLTGSTFIIKGVFCVPNIQKKTADAPSA
jgi:hypothetical protein